MFPTYQVHPVQCAAYAAEPRLGLTRLQLSLRKRNQHFPWFTKKRIVFAFGFQQDGWLNIGPSKWENVTPCRMLDIEGLRKLKADLPLKLKVWTKHCKGKVVLQARLGDFLNHLDSCSTPTTFKITSTGDSFNFSYSVHEQEVVEQVQELLEELLVRADTASVVTEATSAADAVPFAADEELVTENEEEASVCPSASDGEWVTFVNKLTGATCRLPAHTQAERKARWRGPGAWTSEDDLLDGEWVTFVNKFTGATFRLPAHTQAEKEARWRGPGAWTSEEDLLDDKALEIIANIKSMPHSNNGRGVLAFHVRQQNQRIPMPPIDISKRLVEPYVAPSWTNDASSHQMTFSPAPTLTPKLRHLHNRRHAASRGFRLSKIFSWYLCFLLLMLWLKGAEGTHLFLH